MLTRDFICKMVVGFGIMLLSSAAEADSGIVVKLGNTQFRHDHSVTCLSFSPDGKYLASGGSDYTVRLWDRKTGEQARELLNVSDRTNPYAGARQVYAVSFSPDGTLLAAGVGDQAIHVWETATGKERFAGRHQGAVVATVFAPNGKTVYSAGQDGVVRFWDTNHGKELRQLPAKESVHCLALSKDGNTLISGGGDGVVRIWETNSGKELRSIEAHKGPVLAIALASDDHQLATGGQDSSIRIWDISPDHNPQRNPMAWSALPWGRTPGFVPIIQSIEYLRLNQDGAFLNGHSDRVRALLFSRDGKSLLSGGGDGTLREWEVEGKRLKRMLQSGGRAIRALTVAPDGDLLAMGDEFCCIRFWDWKAGKERPATGGHHGSVSSLQLAGPRLVSLGKDQEVYAWQYAERRGLGSLALPPSCAASCLGPHGDLIGWGDGDGAVHIVDQKTGKELRSWKAADSALTCLSFSADGEWIATGSKSAHLSIWETATGKCVEKLEGHEGRVQLLQLSPDGKRLASSSGNDIVHLWDLTTWSEIRQVGESGEEAQSLAFSPDSQTLAIGTRAGVVRLWNVASGQSRWVTEGHPGYVMALAFSGDGKTLAAGSWMTVRLWEVASGRERTKLDRLPGDASALTFGNSPRSLFVGTGSSSIWIFDLANASGAENKELNQKDLEPLWVTLSAADGPRAYKAIWKLVQVPNVSVSFLRERLKPVPLIPKEQKERLAGLVLTLDDEDFERRQGAEKDLRKDLELAEPELRHALEGRLSSEARGRIETLLQEFDSPARQRAEWQSQRAIEVLELIGSPEALEVLRALAAGRPQALLTQEAKSALARRESRK